MGKFCVLLGVSLVFLFACDKSRNRGSIMKKYLHGQLDSFSCGVKEREGIPIDKNKINYDSIIGFNRALEKYTVAPKMSFLVDRLPPNAVRYTAYFPSCTFVKDNDGNTLLEFARTKMGGDSMSLSLNQTEDVELHLSREKLRPDNFLIRKDDLERELEFFRLVVDTSYLRQKNFLLLNIHVKIHKDIRAGEIFRGYEIIKGCVVCEGR